MREPNEATRHTPLHTRRQLSVLHLELHYTGTNCQSLLELIHY